MLSNATNQPKSTVELGYMCPRGLSGPPAVTLTKSLEVLPTFEKLKPWLLFSDGCRPASVVIFWQLLLKLQWEYIFYKGIVSC